MKRFILLLNHDDNSLTAYLQHCLERGEQFVNVSGNIFTFKKTEPSKEQRIAVVTYTCENPDLKMKFELEDYTALMKKLGWQVLSVGKPENIFDSKRHVFLQTDDPELELPETDRKLAEKAKQQEKRSLIRCIVMLLILLGFGIFFLSHDPDVFLSSNHIFIPCLFGFCFWVCSLFCCMRGAAALVRNRQCENEFRNYLHVDHAVLYCMLSVAALVIALLLDMFLFPDTGRTIVREDQRVTVYQDMVPLTLNDLSIPMDGTYHSSRLTKRDGFLMKSMYGYDQSFSDPEGSKDLSLVSYSVFQSNWSRGLDWVACRKGINNYPGVDELSEKWHSDEIHTDGKHRLSVRYPGTLLVISTSADILTVDSDIVLSKLLPNYAALENIVK